MVPEAWRQWLGEPGTIALFAVAVGLIVRVLRTDRANAILEKFGFPRIPAYMLPFLALAFGALLEYLDKRAAGQVASFRDVVMAILTGLLSGSFAVAGHETLVRTPKRVAEHREEKRKASLRPPAPELATEEKKAEPPPDTPKN